MHLDTFHFKSEVLGEKSYSPSGWSSGPDGIEFEMDYEHWDMRTGESSTAKVTVSVPWSNIAFEVKCQAWD